jgi:hypothetical protein
MLVNKVEYRHGDHEWSVGVIENTTDIYLQRRRRVFSEDHINSNIGEYSLEVVGEIRFEQAERELQYVSGNTPYEKYLALFQNNIESRVLHPVLEPFIGGLVYPQNNPNNLPRIDENNYNISYDSD